MKIFTTEDTGDTEVGTCCLDGVSSVASVSSVVDKL